MDVIDITEQYTLAAVAVAIFSLNDCIVATAIQLCRPLLETMAARGGLAVSRLIPGGFPAGGF